MIKIMWYIAGAILFISLMYGGFVVNRWFNFKFGYANQVRAEVCKMVKPEYLKQECKK